MLPILPMLLCHIKFIFSETADGLAGSVDISRADTLITIPYGSSFIVLRDSTLSPTYVTHTTTIHQYNAAEEEFKTLPVNMSKPVGPFISAIPILVDLDMFPTCAPEDTA